MGEFFELMDLWRRQAVFTGGFAALAPAAGFVIATRVAQMAGEAGRPSRAGALEAERMLSEKMSAAFEGAAAARRELADLSWPAHPLDVANVMMSAGEAALKPTARRLKANAQRLSRR